MINVRLDRSSGDAFIYVIKDGEAVFEYFTWLNNQEWNLLSEEKKEHQFQLAVKVAKEQGVL